MSQTHYFVDVNGWPYTGSFGNNFWMFTGPDGLTMRSDTLKGSGMRRVTFERFHKAELKWEGK